MHIYVKKKRCHGSSCSTNNCQGPCCFQGMSDYEAWYGQNKQTNKTIWNFLTHEKRIFEFGFHSFHVSLVVECFNFSIPSRHIWRHVSPSRPNKPGPGLSDLVWIYSGFINLGFVHLTLAAYLNRAKESWEKLKTTQCERVFHPNYIWYTITANKK